jgi:hypothetical protein
MNTPNFTEDLAHTFLYLNINITYIYILSIQRIYLSFLIRWHSARHLLTYLPAVQNRSQQFGCSSSNIFIKKEQISEPIKILLFLTSSVPPPNSPLSPRHFTRKVSIPTNHHPSHRRSADGCCENMKNAHPFRSPISKKPSLAT